MARVKEQPLIEIPGVDKAKVVEIRTKNRGERLVFQLFVDSKQTRIDPNKAWADRDWFALVVRELDRQKIWRYTVANGIFYYVRK